MRCREDYIAIGST